MKMRLILGGQKLATIRVDFGQFNMCGMLWYLHKDHLFWIFGSKLVGEVPWTSHLMLNWFSKIPGKMLNFVKKGDWLIYTPCPESTIHFRNPTVAICGDFYGYRGPKIASEIAYIDQNPLKFSNHGWDRLGLTRFSDIW